MILENSNYIGIIISIILLYVVKFYYQYFTRPNPLPGPIPLPLIGNTLEMVYHVKGDFLSWYNFLHQRYGDVYELYVGNSRQIVLSRADHIEKLMTTSTKTHNFLRIKRFGHEDLGLGPTRGIVFNTYLPTWKSNRQFLLHTFQVPNFSKQVLYGTSKIFDELSDYWKVIDDDVPIDFVTWALKLTTDVVFQAFTGLKVNAMAKHFDNNVETSKKKGFESNYLDEQVANLFESLEEDFYGMLLVLTYPAYIRYTLFRKKNNAMIHSKNRTNEIFTRIVNYRRKEIQETPINEELSHDMLTTLIIANTERDTNEKNYVADEYSEPLTNDQIIDILLEAIAGGSDTFANFLCFVVYYLGRYPDVLARLRQELDSIFGSDPNRQITTDDLSKMYYLEALIKESARHANQSKIIQRISTSTEIIAGYKWPADTTFIINVDAIHLNSIYWKDPHKFYPDRFMEAEPQKNTFLMFGGGMRSCPGKKFALIGVKYLIASIFRNFDVSLVDANAPLKLKNLFTSTFVELMVRIKQREMQV